MPLRVYRQQTTPDFTPLPRGSAPALVDPTGEALQQMAVQFQRIGEGMYQAQLEADLHDRLGRATAELTDLQLGLERDPDFRTAPKRFREGADAIRDKYLAGVTHAGTKLALQKSISNLTLAKALNVQKDAYTREKDYQTATLDANLDTYATEAANAKNPAERDLMVNQARLAIAGAQSGGWIDAVDAGKRERRLLGKLDEAVVLRDLSIDPLVAAAKLSTDPTYAPNVDPVLRERYADRAFRLAESERKANDAAEEKARKVRGDELLKEAFKRQAAGTLKRDYIESIKPFIEPHEYKSLIAPDSMRDDPTAHADVLQLLYSDPAEAKKKAFQYQQAGLLKSSTLSAILTQANSVERQGGPHTPYEREKAAIMGVLAPSEMTDDPAPKARMTLAVREFDDYVLAEKRTPKEMREFADGLIKKYQIIGMEEIVRKTGMGNRVNTRDPAAVIEATRKEAAEVKRRFEAKEITQAEYAKRMKELNDARVAAERANLGK